MNYNKKTSSASEKNNSSNNKSTLKTLKDGSPQINISNTGIYSNTQNNKYCGFNNITTDPHELINLKLKKGKITMNNIPDLKDIVEPYQKANDIDNNENKNQINKNSLNREYHNERFRVTQGTSFNKFHELSSTLNKKTSIVKENNEVIKSNIKINSINYNNNNNSNLEEKSYKSLFNNSKIEEIKRSIMKKKAKVILKDNNNPINYNNLNQDKKYNAYSNGNNKQNNVECNIDDFSLSDLEELERNNKEYYDDFVSSLSYIGNKTGKSKAKNKELKIQEFSMNMNEFIYNQRALDELLSSKPNIEYDEEVMEKSFERQIMEDVSSVKRLDQWEKDNIKSLNAMTKFKERLTKKVYNNNIKILKSKNKDRSQRNSQGSFIFDIITNSKNLEEEEDAKEDNDDNKADNNRKSIDNEDIKDTNNVKLHKSKKNSVFRKIANISTESYLNLGKVKVEEKKVLGGELKKKREKESLLSKVKESLRYIVEKENSTLIREFIFEVEKESCLLLMQNVSFSKPNFKFDIFKDKDYLLNIEKLKRNNPRNFDNRSMKKIDITNYDLDDDYRNYKRNTNYIDNIISSNKNEINKDNIDKKFKENISSSNINNENSNKLAYNQSLETYKNKYLISKSNLLDKPSTDNTSVSPGDSRSKNKIMNKNIHSINEINNKFSAIKLSDQNKFNEESIEKMKLFIEVSDNSHKKIGEQYRDIIRKKSRIEMYFRNLIMNKKLLLFQKQIQRKYLSNKLCALTQVYSKEKAELFYSIEVKKERIKKLNFMINFYFKQADQILSMKIDPNDYYKEKEKKESQQNSNNKGLNKKKTIVASNNNDEDGGVNNSPRKSLKKQKTNFVTHKSGNFNSEYENLTQDQIDFVLEQEIKKKQLYLIEKEHALNQKILIEKQIRDIEVETESLNIEQKKLQADYDVAHNELLWENVRIKRKYKAIKKEYEDLILSQKDYYLDILKKGLDVRNSGLVWIIIRLKELEVSLEYKDFPSILTNEHIEYLKTLANKNIEIQQYKIVYTMKKVIQKSKKEEKASKLINPTSDTVISKTSSQNLINSNLNNNFGSNHLSKSKNRNLSKSTSHTHMNALASNNKPTVNLKNWNLVHSNKPDSSNNININDSNDAEDLSMNPSYSHHNFNFIKFKSNVVNNINNTNKFKNSSKDQDLILIKDVIKEENESIGNNNMRDKFKTKTTRFADKIDTTMSPHKQSKIIFSPILKNKKRNTEINFSNKFIINNNLTNMSSVSDSNPIEKDKESDQEKMIKRKFNNSKSNIDVNNSNVNRNISIFDINSNEINKNILYSPVKKSRDISKSFYSKHSNLIRSKLKKVSILNKDIKESTSRINQEQEENSSEGDNNTVLSKLRQSLSMKRHVKIDPLKSIKKKLSSINSKILSNVSGEFNHINSNVNSKNININNSKETNHANKNISYGGKSDASTNVLSDNGKLNFRQKNNTRNTNNTSMILCSSHTEVTNLSNNKNNMKNNLSFDKFKFDFNMIDRDFNTQLYEDSWIKEFVAQLLKKLKEYPTEHCSTSIKPEKESKYIDPYSGELVPISKKTEHHYKNSNNIANFQETFFNRRLTYINSTMKKKSNKLVNLTNLTKSIKLSEAIRVKLKNNTNQNSNKNIDKDFIKNQSNNIYSYTTQNENFEENQATDYPTSDLSNNGEKLDSSNKKLKNKDNYLLLEWDDWKSDSNNTFIIEIIKLREKIIKAEKDIEAFIKKTKINFKNQFESYKQSNIKYSLQYDLTYSALFGNGVVI